MRARQRISIPRRHAGLALLVITLVGAALRLYHLGFHQLWVDESFSAWVSTFAPVDIVYICLQDFVHPPLYYFLLSFWTAVAGISEFALRMLSAGASLLTVPLLYQLGRRGWDRRTGLAAALLWACSPFALWYAQEARMYALLTLVGTAALLCLAQALPGGSRRWLFANAALNLAGLYSHYLYLFLLVGQLFYLVLTLRRHRRAFWPWALANGVAVVLYAPWVATILLGGLRSAGIAWIAPLSWGTLFGTFWQLNTGYHQTASVPGAIITVILASGLVAEAVFGWRHYRSTIPGLAWMSLVVPIVLIALISLRVPLFYSRFLQLVLPVYLLLAAAGLMRLARPAVGAALVAVVVLLGGLVLQEMYVTPTRYKQDWKDAMHTLAGRVESGDVVAFRDRQGWYPYRYYYDGPSLKEIDLALNEGAGEFGARLNGTRRAWLVLWDPAPSCQPPDHLLPEPSDPLQIVDQMCFPAVLVVSYAWQGEPP